jgi:hypothetical protein
MSTYKSARQLPAEAAAYIAGLIDGEGTITLTRSHAGGNRHLMVCIANTELPMLQYVLGEIGAGKITRKRAISVRHTPSFCYAIGNRQALAVLQQVAPFLRTHKCQRAQLILDRYLALTPRNGKYTSAQRNERALFEHDVLAITARASSRNP